MKDRSANEARLIGPLLLLALAGCTTYVGHKLPASGALPENSTGVPFMMTRPEYSVDITADPTDATKAVYTLNETDVPDSTRRFSLRLDPSLLVDGSFDFAFDENGNISKSTTTSTSRVVATLQSVVGFAINVAAKGVAKDEGTDLTRYESLAYKSTAAQCTKAIVKGAAPTVGRSIADTISSLRQEALVEVTEAVPDKRNDEAALLVRPRFYYVSLLATNCLVELVAEATGESDKDVAARSAEYDKAAKALAVSDASVNPGKRAEAITDLVKTGTRQSRDDLSKAPEEATPQLKSFRSAALAFMNAKLSSENLLSLAMEFSRLNPDSSRARLLQHLERQIVRRRFELSVATVTHGSDPVEVAKLQGEIRSLQEEWGATLQAQPQLKRLSQLDAFIAEVRTTRADGGGQRYAIDEMVKARSERDTLQDQVDHIRSLLVAKADAPGAKPEKPKVVPRMAQEVKLVRQSFVNKVAANPAGFVKAELPEFILVLGEQTGSTITPDPTVPGQEPPKVSQ